MAKGENIFKRKDGRWEARYIKSRDITGKIRYGFCYGKTYREAKEKVTEKKAFAQRANTELWRFDLPYYCDKWLEHIQDNIKESTFAKYQSVLKNHIKSYFKGVAPSSLSDEMISDFRRKLLRENGLSEKTVKDILIVLRSVLKYMEKSAEGDIPHIEIVYPKPPNYEMRVLTREEQRRLEHYLCTDMDFCKFGIYLALYTGLRLGEIATLRWQDISRENRTLLVSSTMQRLPDPRQTCGRKTRVVITPPKSRAGVRVIPLSDELYELCRRMDPEKPKAFVLTGNECYMEPRTLQYRFHTIAKACNLEKVHFHTLRHSFATRCVEVGFDVKSLSEILGHANSRITLDRYVHSSMELKREHMNKLTKPGKPDDPQSDYIKERK